jgi:putative oxidoreductase
MNSRRPPGNDDAMAHVDTALLVLRIALGITMALHGANKIRGGLDGVGGWFESMGMRPGKIQAFMAAYTEVFGGIAFAAGFLTPLSAAAMIALMVVAIVTAHRSNGFFIFNEGQGWEYCFMLAVTAYAVGAIGPGKYSVDHAIDLHFTGWHGTVISLAVGIGSASALLAACYRPPRSAS